MPKPDSCIFYRGPSRLDGEEIVAIATTGSDNRKTGDMIQTWILRTSHSPTEAVRLGHDSSICGDCYHRGARGSRGSADRPRTCYVNVGQAPQGIWRKFRRRGYPKMHLREFLEQRGGQALRMGSYGDPVAVPIAAWDGASSAHTRTGYTHQWRRAAADPFRSLIMASCDSPAEAMDAARHGWRTFLVRPMHDPSIVVESIECLADSHGKTCVECGLCRGTQGAAKAPSIWIEAHGTAKRFVGAL